MKVNPTPAPEGPVPATHLLRAGYHAWWYEVARINRKSPKVSAAQEGRELANAIEKADQDAVATDTFDQGIADFHTYLKERTVMAGLRSGRLLGVVRTGMMCLSRGSKRAYAWWNLGLNLAAIEPWPAGSRKRRAGMGKIRRCLRVIGLPADHFETWRGLPADKLLDAVESLAKAQTPGPADMDLLRLEAQHRAGVFPEDELLRRLGCSSADIAYLQFLCERSPQPVSYSAAGTHFSVSPGAIAQRYRGLPSAVRDRLIVDVGRLKKKAWRPPTTH